MVAGLIYGRLLGIVLVLIGAFIGASLTFFLARTFLRGFAQKRLTSFSKFQFVDNLVSREGLKFIFLTRLSPLFPFGLLNLTYGITNVSIKDFIIGLFAILPGTFLYCGLGSLAGKISRFNYILSNRNDLLSLLFSAVSLIATLGVVFYVSRAAKSALTDYESFT